MRARSALAGFVFGLFPSLACTPHVSSRTQILPASFLEEGPVAGAPRTTWANVTQSPWPLSLDANRTDRESAFAEMCGAQDGALARVARELVELRTRGLDAPDSETVTAKLRAAGEPHVRPRVIYVTGRAPVEEAKDAKRALAARSSSEGPGRCGIAIATLPEGREMLVVLRVEALADLAPLPTRARTGEWLSFEAHLYVPVHTATVMVLGPRGAPRTVPTSFDTSTGTVRARFALDTPGAFTIQLIAELADGPRPLLEARVFADVSPSLSDEDEPATAERGDNSAEALAGMVATLRASQGSPPLARDSVLDSLARAHAANMRDRHVVAHDLGDGDFRVRVEADGRVNARAVGENVTHAASVALAHRALHTSPSHRLNLLRADYTRFGVGVAQAVDGSVYVCETFAVTNPARARP